MIGQHDKTSDGASLSTTLPSSLRPADSRDSSADSRRHTVCSRGSVRNSRFLVELD